MQFQRIFQHVQGDSIFQWINIFLMPITSNYLKSLWINEISERDQVLRPAFKLENRANIIKNCQSYNDRWKHMVHNRTSTQSNEYWCYLERRKQLDRFKTMSQCFKLKPFGHFSINWHRLLSKESSLRKWQCQLTLRCQMAFLKVFWSTKKRPL